MHDQVVILTPDHLWVLLLAHDHTWWVIILHLVSSDSIIVGSSVVRVENGPMGHTLNHLALNCSLLFSLPLSQLLLTLNSGPIDSISHWLATSAEDWERIQPRIGAKDLFPILLTSHIVYALEWLSKFIEVLNRSLVVAGEHDMEFEECSHQACNDNVKDKRDHDHDVVTQIWIVARKEFVVKTPKDGLVKVVHHGQHCGVSDKEHINQEENKVLPVPKADAVVDPRAVMVHVEHASVASGAVMASLRLEDIAHEAVPPPFVFIVSQMEAPEHWNLSGISCHGLEEGPN